MNGNERHAILVIALILLHLAAFSQDKKYVKKKLSWSPDSTFQPVKQAASASPLWSIKDLAMPQGFICRKEYQLEKKVGIPIKVRLGTYQEAHRLEYGQ